MSICYSEVDGLPGADGVYEIDFGGVKKLEVKFQGLNHLENVSKLLVCFSGAVGDRKDKAAPFFSGLSLAKELNLPILAISDPILKFNNTLGLGWYAGFSLWTELLQDIARFLEALKVDLVIFGGSGGGYASIAVGSILETPAKILVWNPQVSISNYDIHFVEEYLKASFPDSNFDWGELSLMPQLERRFAYKEIMQSAGIYHDLVAVKFHPLVQLLYLQNKSDWHVAKHLVPFMQDKIEVGGVERIEGASFSMCNRQISVALGHWGEGHAAPPKEAIKELINLAFDGVDLTNIARKLSLGEFSGITKSPAIGMTRADNEVKPEIYVTVENGELWLRGFYSAGEVTFAFWLLSSSGKKLLIRDFGPESSLVVSTDNAEQVVEVIFLVKDIAGFIKRVRKPIPECVKKTLNTELFFENKEQKLGSEHVDLFDAHKKNGKDLLRGHLGRVVADTIVAEYERLQTVDALAEFSAQCVSRGVLAMPSFSGGGFAICDRSVFSEDVNFLFFRDGNLSFFVVQIRRVVDGFYFPGIDIFYGRVLGSVVSQVKRLAHSLFKGGAINDYLLESKAMVFKGWLASQRLPYHYFYDVMPAVNFVLSKFKEHSVFAFKDGCYVDLKYLYGVDQLTLNSSAQFAWDAHGFYFSLLRNEVFGKLTMHVDVEDFVESKLPDLKLKCSRGLSFDGNNPVIWLGILAGKRTWLEQVEAYSKFVKEIKSRFSAPFFIFDGITSSCLSSVESPKHRALIDEVLVSAPSTSYLNLDGATSAEKLYFSSLVDFYICDSATASMYVSRFSKKTGVVYSAPGAKLYGHIHHGAVFVPDSMVTNCSSPKATWEYSDFSINPNEFLSFALNVFDSKVWRIT